MTNHVITLRQLFRFQNKYKVRTIRIQSIGILPFCRVIPQICSFRFFLSVYHYRKLCRIWPLYPPRKTFLINSFFFSVKMTWIYWRNAWIRSLVRKAIVIMLNIIIYKKTNWTEKNKMNRPGGYRQCRRFGSDIVRDVELQLKSFL